MNNPVAIFGVACYFMWNTKIQEKITEAELADGTHNLVEGMWHTERSPNILPFNGVDINHYLTSCLSEKMIAVTMVTQ